MGTHSRNVRVWRTAASSEQTPNGRIYMGHQDGKVRVWRASAEDPATHRHVGPLPWLRDVLGMALPLQRPLDAPL
ncbi:hypothetical protein C2845_PM13G16600 [Panicum miliaceum]|uniref:Uncharacterized protein n=1 Tax=Panicum miliaceum TaxID=4540 RepID=A0A3L6RJ52_PANMI|nr:hypothetical protein C2845_PM13G16600 [Panicum miliaceum]